MVSHCYGVFQIDGQSLRDKTFDEVLELLKQANPDDDGKKKILKQMMPPFLASIASDIDLDASKIDSLLTHSPPKYVYISIHPSTCLYACTSVCLSVYVYMYVQMLHVYVCSV